MAKRRPKIRAHKISKKSVKSYSYTLPNPGVRAIAAINGRGSFRRRGISARRQMSGLKSPEERRENARRLLANLTRSTGNRSKMKRRILRNVRRMRQNAWKESKSAKVVRFVAPRHRSAAVASWKRRKGTKKAKKVSAKRKKTSAKKVSVKRKLKPNRRTRRRVARKAPVKRRKARKTAKRRVVSRKRKSVKATTKRRKSTRRKSTRRKTARKSRRVAMTPNRRHYRRNGKPNRRYKSGAYSRRMFTNRRKSGRKSFRALRNGAMEWLKLGALIAAGLAAHKLTSGLIKNLLMSNDVAVADTAKTQAAESGAAATSGILPSSMAPYGGVISSLLAAAAGIYLVNRFVKDSQTKNLLSGGMAASAVHGVAISLLKRSPSTAKYANSISGLGSDGAAARLSAMYGVGSSILPMYQPVGEYFSSGVGEYFSSGVGALGAAPYEAAAGMGEYFASGVGAYESNPDAYQAAAGYGAVETRNTNHIDPGSDLDAQLTIAEAAAGIGNYPMQAAAGLGNPSIHTIGTSQTWIPGETNPGIWAGVRPVDEPQSFSAQVPAGILESGGGQGVFG